MINKIKFLVVIPTYNRVVLLQRAIKSVLKQTYSDFKLVIVDDASQDSTAVEIAKIYKTYSKISLIRNIKNKGVSFSRNTAIKKFNKIKWVALLDSDDEWIEDKLIKQVEDIQSNKDVRLFHTQEAWIRSGKKVNPKKIHLDKSGDLYQKSLNLCLISPSSVVIKRELFDEVGYFREDYTVCEDFDLWLRILYAEDKAVLNVNKLVIKYGGHCDQLSQMYHSMDWYRIRTLFNLINTNNCQNSVEIMKKKYHILMVGREKRIKITVNYAEN